MTLRVDLRLPSGPVRRWEPAEVTVSVTNTGPEAVLINSRMSPGYVESFPREVYFELDAEYGRLKYDRDISGDSDYRPLDPGATVSTTIDLLHWYRITEPGGYLIVACYQGDEPGSRPPVGIVRGVVRSRTAEVTVQ